MTRQLLHATVVAILALLFNYFFWEEKLGINLVLFNVLVVAALLFLKPDSLKNKYVWLSILGVLISGVGVVVFNSAISKFSNISFMAVLVGFVHRSEFKSVMNALTEVLVSLFTVFSTIAQMFKAVLNRISGSSKILSKLFTYIKLAFIPIVIFFIFFIIFLIANPIFRDTAFNSIDFVFDLLDTIIARLSFARIAFFLFGLYLSSIAVIGGKKLYAPHKSKLNDTLVRIRKTGQKHINPIALKNEHKIALMTIISVNVLFLIVNIIDVKWLWLAGTIDSSSNWSDLVHEGTYMLILSIVLAMGILLYYFKGNLNFYRKVKVLRLTAYFWIFQNTILAISVALRSFYYIQVHGLAYKRIGVIIFLILAVFGLYTLFIKINKVKSAYYLFRINSWAAFAMLVVMSTINWDMWIVQHNFNHPQLTSGEIDIDYMISRADRTLVIIDKNQGKINMEENFNRLYGGGRWLSNQDYTRSIYLNERKEDFMINYENHTWLSWNLADQQTYNYFRDNKN